MSLPLLFALAFPIEAPPGEPVFAIEIPAAAYATLTTTELSDLAVLDASGQPQSISLLRPSPAPPAEPVATPLPMPIAMPEAAARQPERLDLHIGRDAEGRLARLDLQAGTSVLPGDGSEWLVDATSASSAGIDGLRLQPATGVADFRVLVDVRASDDLVQWVPIASALPLMRVSDGARIIERLDLRFPTTRNRYFALAVGGSTGTLPRVDGIAALRMGGIGTAAERSVTLRPTGQSAADQGWAARYAFPSPGPLPVSAITVQAGGSNAVHEFLLDRGEPEARQVLMGGTTWRFDIGGRPLDAGRQPATLVGHGPLSLQTRPAAVSPALELHYVPDRVIVIASGTPPYRLLAGSGQYRAAPVPMQQALAGIRAVRGSDWLPPLAAVGDAVVAGGEAALSAQRPIPVGRLALWIVLALGAALVAGFAWRLLREGGPSAA